MTAIVTPATLGTIKATTLGNFIWQITNWAIQAQKDTVKNPNAVDYVSLTTDTEVVYESYPAATGGAATISVSFPAGYLAIPVTTTKAIRVPDYLTNSGYLPGTEGTPTFTSTSWCESLTEAIVLMHWLQNDLSKNPLNLKPVSNWSLTAVNNTGSILNSTFTASVELPLIQTVDSVTGNSIISGASPLGSLT